MCSALFSRLAYVRFFLLELGIQRVCSVLFPRVAFVGCLLIEQEIF